MYIEDHESESHLGLQFFPHTHDILNITVIFHMGIKCMKNSDVQKNYPLFILLMLKTREMMVKSAQNNLIKGVQSPIEFPLYPCKMVTMWLV